MRLLNNNHLMYGLNIHAGESWQENLAAIQQYALAVKKRICPDDPFALGLRLSALAAAKLQPQIKDFARFLQQHQLYVVTINGFPYGTFHDAVIKENVYLPDWSSPQRVSYTLNLAHILANLLPEGETGTISTVPAYYGKMEKPSAMVNLLSVAKHLATIRKETGKYIILALEPEPDCCLDHLDSTLQFFQRLYTPSNIYTEDSIYTDDSHIDNSHIDDSRDHLGICLDTCHAATEFESPFLWLQKLTEAGISVPKIQISAALKALVTAPHQSQELFVPFNDRQYLHQTRVLNGKNITRFKDLPDALAESPAGEWRVHFHVPLIWSKGAISSTAGLIENNLFQKIGLQGGRHIEVETYSYALLPGPRLPIVDSIVVELEWVRQRFGFCGKQE